MIQEILNEIDSLNEIILYEHAFLGAGSFGNVYGYQIKDQMIAVKCFRKDKKKEAEGENKILENLKEVFAQCPGAVKYYGMKFLRIKFVFKFISNLLRVIDDEGQDVDLFHGGLFFSKCDTDLKKLMELRQQQGIEFSVNEAFSLLTQLSITLAFLRIQNCYHRDLTPANILINFKKNSELQFMLADFGVSQLLNNLRSIDVLTLKCLIFLQILQIKALRGTPKYFSPELFQGYSGSATEIKYNPMKADVYSLGIIIIELLLGAQCAQTISNLQGKL